MVVGYVCVKIRYFLTSLNEYAFLLSLSSLHLVSAVKVELRVLWLYPFADGDIGNSLRRFEVTMELIVMT